ncbi:MAG: hypothetical protein COA49_08435 [Bacteroidetes bacterium]|nr:MAG: hypothetical protein COA49_08435 [Bacteroidota bacterium]
MKSITLPILSLIVINSSTYAQEASTSNSDTLKMDVTFVGEREMVVKDALKLQSWPELRTLESGNKEFSYRLLAKRMNVNPIWTMIDPVRLRVDAPLSLLYRGYARAGYGVYNTPIIELSMTDLRSREGTWGFQSSHFATDAPLGLVDERFQDSDAGVWLSRFIGKERVDLAANIERDNIVYYGNVKSDTLPPDTSLGTHERYLKYGGNVSFKSHHRDSTDMNHEIDLGWQQFRDLSGTTENYFEGTFSMGKFVDQERFALDGSINVDRLQMTSLQGDTTKTDGAIISLTPTATSYRGPLTIRAGAGLWIDADSQSRNGLGSTFHFYPKLEASIRILRDVFVPYVSLDGGLEQNRFASVIQKNSFYQLTPDSEFLTTSRSRDLEVGMRGTLTQAISFQIYASSTHYEDYMYFVNDSLFDSGARFSTIYDTLGVKEIGGYLTLDLFNNLNLRVAGSLFTYDTNGLEAAWNLPSTKWSIDARYEFLEKFSIDASVQIMGSRQAITQIKPSAESVAFQQIGDVYYYNADLPSYIDANIGVEYRYNRRTSVWMKLSNITNSNYRQWAGYSVQGFQAMLGASYAF